MSSRPRCMALELPVRRPGLGFSACPRMRNDLTGENMRYGTRHVTKFQIGIFEELDRAGANLHLDLFATVGGLGDQEEKGLRNQDDDHCVGPPLTNVTGLGTPWGRRPLLLFHF